MSLPPSTSQAARAVRAAERCKLTVPDTVREAAAVQSAVWEAEHTPDPDRPALPDTAAETAAAIQQHAEALRLADATRQAAGLFSAEADERYARAVAACGAGWVAALDKPFRSLVAAVRKAADKLPHDVDAARLDWNNPTITTAYTKAEAAVVQLEQLVADRNAMATVHGDDGARERDLLAVAAPPQPTREAVRDGLWRDRYAPVLVRWRELRHQPVTRWVHLVRQDAWTLSLAAPGEVQQRAADVEAWREAVAAAGAPQRSNTVTTADVVRV